jgi:threonyl-tRNA synthetase
MNSSFLKIRNSAAEILASVVLDLLPGALLIGGTGTEIGFYYDFIFKQKIDENFIPLLEEKMRAIIKEDIPLQNLDMMRENGGSFLKHHRQDIRAYFALEAKENIISLLKIGNFHDYCQSSCLSTSSEMGVFKILNIFPINRYVPTMGDVRVTRIQGTAFLEPQSLKKFIKKLENAKGLDHVQLGKEMKLFTFQEDASLGCSFWETKGMALRNFLLELWRKKHQNGFHLLHTPSIIKKNLLKRAGFFDDPLHEDVKFPTFSAEGCDYVSSPTVAPQHCLTFMANPKYLSDLPVRYTEHREFFEDCCPEKICGLLKSRSYSKEVTHIFCTLDQIDKELISSLQFIDKSIKMFGFEYHWYLIPRGRKSAGTKADWEKGTQWITKALKDCGFAYTTDLDAHSFYGPRVALRFKDVLGREWEGPYIEIDLNLVEKLGVRYQESEGRMIAPVMLAISMFGSLDRFIAILLEHYAGLLPLWIAPEQIRMIPVGEKNFKAAEVLKKKIQLEGFRVGIDCRNDKLGSKIHSAETERIPYMVIVGEKEEKGDVITIRTCQNQKKLSGMNLESFLKKLREEETVDY